MRKRAKRVRTGEHDVSQAGKDELQSTKSERGER